MKNRLMGSIFGVGVLAFSTVVLAQRPAQQPEAAAKPAPRTPDGKPDLSGTWRTVRTTGGEFAREWSFGESGSPGTFELTKWGLDKFTWNRSAESSNAPGVYKGQHARYDQDPKHHCYPMGLVRLGPPNGRLVGQSSLIEIARIPGMVLILFEYDHEVREIYTDGREHPKHLELTWNGHSIGRWDGDTFVVDTIGLRDENWLDYGGTEHSTQLHVVERFRRVDAQTLEIERTLTDPIALAKPFTITTVLRLRPDEDLDENEGADCAQYMLRKPAFGQGIGGLLGISEPTTGRY